MPDSSIKLILWYQYSATLKSFIFISSVSLSRINLKRPGIVNQATFEVKAII